MYVYVFQIKAFAEIKQMLIHNLLCQRSDVYGEIENNFYRKFPRYIIIFYKFPNEPSKQVETLTDKQRSGI